LTSPHPTRASVHHRHGDPCCACLNQRDPREIHVDDGDALCASHGLAAGEAGWPAEELPFGDYKVVVKACSKDIVAPRVKVTLGQAATVRLVMKNGQLVLE
jgi:hypothetical protein